MPTLLSLIALCEVSQADGPVEAVFRAIDGQDCEVDGDICHVKVYGIYDAGGDRWVQLALDGARKRMMTLRMGKNEVVACALVSLAVTLS